MSQPPRKPDFPSYPHVEIHDDGVPYIAGTTMKIVELVDSKEAYGWGPEELHFQFPHLTLGMVYGALAYYWDHQQEVDLDRERRLQSAEEYRLQDGPSPLAAKIRAGAVANSPDLGTEIDSTHEAIADLSRLPVTTESEAQAEQTFARLRDLQHREAEQFREQFEDNLMMPLDSGERILERSRNLRKQLEDLAAPDSSTKEPASA